MNKLVPEEHKGKKAWSIEHGIRGSLPIIPKALLYHYP
jgi:hypothetical protein